MSTVISLADYTGNFVAPWVAAGYDAILVDPQHVITRWEGNVCKFAGTVEDAMPYLAKIINSLSRKGLVTTQRGVGGGVTLARPATDISMYDVCVALDDPVIRSTCMLGTAPCSDERACPAHKVWTATRGKVLDFLRETSVADIAAFETKRRWNSSVELGVSARPARRQPPNS